jgi:hypothetical protein
MSGTTQADVHAQGAAASAKEVETAQALPAPSNEIEQAIASLGNRISGIERALGLVTPLVNDAAAVAGMVMPAAAPVLDRLPLIETAVEGILSALGNAFGEKVPGLPPSGSATAPAPSSGT